PALPGPAHPRRARVVIGGVEISGVWVRDDGVWIPMIAAERQARANRGDDFMPDLVCDGDRCARPFARLACAEPECPAMGDLLIIDAPLGAHAPWPTGEDAWNREIEAMERDPVLLPLFRPMRPSFPHPVPQHKAPRGWLSNPFTHTTLE